MRLLKAYLCKIPSPCTCSTFVYKATKFGNPISILGLSFPFTIPSTKSLSSRLFIQYDSQLPPNSTGKPEMDLFLNLRHWRLKRSQVSPSKSQKVIPLLILARSLGHHITDTTWLAEQFYTSKDIQRAYMYRIKLKHILNALRKQSRSICYYLQYWWNSLKLNNTKNTEIYKHL